MAKKRPGYTRTTISVPVDLKKRMDKVREDVNWSALACQAFQDKLAEIATQKERRIMASGMTEKERAEVAKRLAVTKDYTKRPRYKTGWTCGVAWAKKSANVDQLQRLANVTVDLSFGPGSLCVEGNSPYERVASAIDHAGTMGVDHLWRHLIHSLNLKVSLTGKSGEQPWRDPFFLQGFVDGATAVWREVREQV